MMRMTDEPPLVIPDRPHGPSRQRSLHRPESNRTWDPSLGAPRIAVGRPHPPDRDTGPALWQRLADGSVASWSWTTTPASPARSTLLLGRDGLGADPRGRDRTDAIELAERERPELVSVDLTLGDDDGVELVRQLREAHPHVVLVVLTASGTADNAVRCLRAGATAFIPKSCQPDEIVTAIEAAAEGHTWLPPAPPRARGLAAARPAAGQRVGGARVHPLRSRARRARADGGRPRPPSDRRRAGHLAQHGADPREEHPGQARRPCQPRGGERRPPCRHAPARRARTGAARPSGRVGNRDHDRDLGPAEVAAADPEVPVVPIRHRVTDSNPSEARPSATSPKPGPESPTEIR